VDSSGYISENLRGWAQDGQPNILSASNARKTGEDPNKWVYDNIHDSYPLFGQLDDVADFDAIPVNLTSDDEPLFYEVGKTVINAASKAVVVCGSVGEVANEPVKGDGFQYPFTFFQDDFDVASDMYLQRHTVWGYTALKAPDQLRQRVAWALSQICVVGFMRLDDGNTEAVLQYYDIFVRHAFGSYRDILKQVAFSEPMGTFLSSKWNKSHQYSKTFDGVDAYPDENFAREVRVVCFQSATDARRFSP